jgi:hypothetical protein
LAYREATSLFSIPVEADEATPAVLAAFRAACDDGRPPVECYRAGVEAWRHHHPDQAPEYAAKRAVAVILAHNTLLRAGP